MSFLVSYIAKSCRVRFVQPHVVEIKGVYKNIKCALEWVKQSNKKDMSSTEINQHLREKIKLRIIENVLKHRSSSEKKQNTGAAEEVQTKGFW